MPKYQPPVYACMRDRLNANSKEWWLHDRDPEKSWTRMPCRIWQGAMDGGGYGKMNTRSRFRDKKGRRKIKQHRAHRVSLADHLGVPVWMLNNVGHHCDNRPCIEPIHLISWTRSKNMLDMIAKGRGKNQFGSAERKAA